MQKRKERTLDICSQGAMEEEDTATEHEGYEVARRLVLDELDLEIRMGQKLQETVESRIAWAMYLQSSLSAVTEKQSSGTTVDTSHTIPFQLAAQDALNIAEAPLLPILSREARFPTRPTLDVTPAPPATLSTNPYARPHTRHTRLRRSPSAILPTPKLLYLRDSSTNAIARLLCPDCQRGDFPRVQSLLNHCRIQHGREFGSHDECIRGCAVQVPAEEEAWVIENGSELRNFSLPSLRRLFEIAVGSAGSPLEITAPNDAAIAQRSDSQEEIHAVERDTPQTSVPLPALTSTHLSRTLGHHADTPDLAPFLGRTPKRRGIAAHDENTPVDIDSGLDVISQRRWKKPLNHRSRARPALDVAVPVEGLLPQFAPNVTPVTQGTRFHIVARVTVSDRSLWIPIDRRSATAVEHTHRWWLSIEAPTYSLPLSSILERATVTYSSPSDSSTLTFHAPLEVSGPSFFVSGTTAHPFLARLRLEWTSGSLNPPLEVDHWVELDMLRAGAPVLGDEQVLDVELDHNTVFRPVANSTKAPDPLFLYNESRHNQVEPGPAIPGYVVLLRSLVPKFPLTLRDAKGGATAELPYRLVSSRAQFRALVPGRRKAIEWGRARVLREAYEEIRVEQAPRDDYPRLSTGDVFSWLADTGFSHYNAMSQSMPVNVPSRKRTSERISPSAIDTFCAACGLGLSQHPATATKASREGPSRSTCPFSPMSRLPLLDVGPHACANSHDHPNGPVHHLSAQKRTFHWSIREVLAATDPSLTLAVRGIIVALKLSCFPESPRTSISGDGVITPSVDSDNTPRLDFSQISEEYVLLASSAVLALAVREFAHQLLHPAITAFASHHARGRGRAVLAPAHVSRGAAGSFLARDGVLTDLPPSPVVALALSTLVQHRQSSAVMETL
ncbi:hypothetical protein BJV78DRAFT_517407 [Lactifluus subvellereus]|nr:hypothetical protein BJV78DRAFT_517407 [Lactifluus subvellereus]